MHFENHTAGVDLSNSFFSEQKAQKTRLSNRIEETSSILGNHNPRVITNTHNLFLSTIGQKKSISLMPNSSGISQSSSSNSNSNSSTQKRSSIHSMSRNRQRQTQPQLQQMPGNTSQASSLEQASRVGSAMLKSKDNETLKHCNNTNQPGQLKQESSLITFQTAQVIIKAPLRSSETTYFSNRVSDRTENLNKDITVPQNMDQIKRDSSSNQKHSSNKVRNTSSVHSKSNAKNNVQQATYQDQSTSSFSSTQSISQSEEQTVDSLSFITQTRQVIAAYSVPKSAPTSDQKPLKPMSIQQFDSSIFDNQPIHPRDLTQHQQQQQQLQNQDSTIHSSNMLPSIQASPFMAEKSKKNEEERTRCRGYSSFTSYVTSTPNPVSQSSMAGTSWQYNSSSSSNNNNNNTNKQSNEGDSDNLNGWGSRVLLGPASRDKSGQLKQKSTFIETLKSIHAIAQENEQAFGTRRRQSDCCENILEISGSQFSASNSSMIRQRRLLSSAIEASRILEKTETAIQLAPTPIPSSTLDQPHLKDSTQFYNQSAKRENKLTLQTPIKSKTGILSDTKQVKPKQDENENKKSSLVTMTPARGKCSFHKLNKQKKKMSQISHLMYNNVLENQDLENQSGYQQNSQVIDENSDLRQGRSNQLGSSKARNYDDDLKAENDSPDFSHMRKYYNNKYGLKLQQINDTDQQQQLHDQTLQDKQNSEQQLKFKSSSYFTPQRPRIKKACPVQDENQQIDDMNRQILPWGDELVE